MLYRLDNDGTIHVPYDSGIIAEHDALVELVRAIAEHDPAAINDAIDAHDRHTVNESEPSRMLSYLRVAANNYPWDEVPEWFRTVIAAAERLARNRSS